MIDWQSCKFVALLLLSTCYWLYKPPLFVAFSEVEGWHAGLLAMVGTVVLISNATEVLLKRSQIGRSSVACTLVSCEIAGMVLSYDGDIRSVIVS